MSSRRAYRNGAVASAHPLASAAGVKVLKAGGNAVDAAVATSLVLGVVAPAFSGIGGGGFLMVRTASGETVYIDYRETAPRRSTPDMYHLDEDGHPADFANSMGHRSVGVPGTVAGLEYALEKYGSMKLRDVAQHAIVLARDGFEVSRFVGTIMSNNIDNSAQKFRRFSESGREWLKDGRTYRAGEKKVSLNFARSLKLIADGGSEAFYHGPIAEALSREMSQNGGLVDREDLSHYRIKVREPVKGSYRGYEVQAMPPPSMGGIAIVQLLNIFEDLDLAGTGLNSAETIATMARALTVVWSKLRKVVGDPDYVKFDLAKLASKDHAAKLWFGRGERGANPDATGRNWTTHVSVVDGDRNVAALTESLECYFGSGVVAPGTGFFLNDTMHDFEVAPGSPNSIEPGKRPLSNMTPTLVLKDGEPLLVAGSAAGPRITTATLQTILNFLDHGLDIQAAVDAPRFHYQGSGAIKMESRIGPAVRRRLKTMGFETESPNYVQLREGYDVYFGGVNAISIGAKGELRGGADTRRQGAVAGY